MHVTLPPVPLVLLPHPVHGLQLFLLPGFPLWPPGRLLASPSSSGNGRPADRGGMQDERMCPWPTLASWARLSNRRSRSYAVQGRSPLHRSRHRVTLPRGAHPPPQKPLTCPETIWLLFKISCRIWYSANPDAAPKPTRKPVARARNIPCVSGVLHNN